MKKLIAISVMLALVAGAAFAETSISAGTELRMKLLEVPDFDDVTTLYGINRTGSGAPYGLMAGSYIKFKGADDDNTWKGVLGLDWTGYSSGQSWPGGFFFSSAWIAWAPIPQLEIFLGQDGDGKFQKANMTRWGFHRMDRGVTESRWEAHDYIIGGWDGVGLALTAKPMDMLALSLVIDLGDREAAILNSPWPGGVKEWKDVKDGIQFQADMNFDFGNIAFTYRKINQWPTNAASGVDDNGRIGLSYSGALMEGLELEVGGNYLLWDDSTGESMARFGLAVYYGTGDWGVKFRALGDIYDDDDAFSIYGDIMPWFALDMMEVRINIGYNLTQGGDFGWMLNPYIKKDFDNGEMRVGMVLQDWDGDGNQINLKIPVSFLINF